MQCSVLHPQSMYDITLCNSLRLRPPLCVGTASEESEDERFEERLEKDRVVVC